MAGLQIVEVITETRLGGKDLDEKCKSELCG